MKRFTKTLVVAAVAVATVAAILVGCKKEKNEETAAKAYNSEAQAVLDRIKSFKELCDAFNAGAKADGSMTVEEMRQILDLTTNYEHSEHMTYCENTVLDTLRVAMPAVDGEGNVSEADVVATYNAFEAALENCMAAANDGRDVPSLFSIVMPNVGSKDDDDIDIVFVRGTVSSDGGEPDDGPFPENSDWLWGKNLGLCKPDIFNSAEGDATTQLSPYFAFHPDPQHQGQTYTLANVIHTIYRPCDQVIPDYTSIYYVDTIIDCADTWLFCDVTLLSEEPCILSWQLNCYYESIVRNIVSPNAPLHFAPIASVAPPAYYACTIDWREFPKNETNLYYKIHIATVTYADVLWTDNTGGTDE